MPGLDTRRLVLLQATCSSPGELDTYSLGTGYFVTPDLVLTARHTVRDHRVNKLEVRTEADGRWRAANAEPIWDNPQLDQADAVTAYARFNAASPPDYVYTSVLDGLRPLADLPLNSAPAIRNAIRSLETRLQSLRS